MSNPNELNNEKPISAHPDPEVPNTTHNPNENSVPTTEAPDPVVPGAQRAADPKPGGPKPGDHPAPGNPKPAGDHPTPPKPGFSGPTGNTPVDGELTYDDKVIQKIIGIALEHVDGLLTVDGGFFSNIAEKLVNTDNVTSGISTEVGKKQVAVDLDIVVEYGRNIPDVAEQVKSVIEKEVTNMTQLEVVEVNINVLQSMKKIVKLYKTKYLLLPQKPAILLHVKQIKLSMRHQKLLIESKNTMNLE